MIEPITENTLTSDDQVDFVERDIVRKAVSKLQEDFREVVELYYYDSFSYEQIAKICGISDSLVKTRLFRAKKKLLELLSPLRSEIHEL
jgi:RNA polymerase sigma-70 factor (ECF subfamily)